MADVDFPWFVAGGWAIELFLGTQTREHEDLEIASPSSFFETLPPRFPEFDFWVPQGERKLAPMSTETLAGEWHRPGRTSAPLRCGGLTCSVSRTAVTRGSAGGTRRSDGRTRRF
jgi:Aminoglycoside-2''-adenylyltransferase